MTRRVLSLAVGGLLILAYPTPALGAGVVAGCESADTCVFLFTSGPEANDFRIQIDGAGQVVVSDARPGAQLIRASDRLIANCTQVDAATVSCSPGALGISPPYALAPVLGPGDSLDPGAPGCDEAPFALIAASAEAEAGAAATLVGTAADDEINTFGNAAVLSCAGKDDVTSSGASGQRVTVSLGDDKDRLDGQGRFFAVIDGEGGKDLVDVDRGIIHGGAGGDVLYEGRGRSELFGDGGSDFLGSGPGKDLLDGGSGNDRLEAGQRRRGNPIRVRLLPGASDQLHCGAGRDQAVAGRNSRLRGCEQVRHLPLTVIQA